MSRMVRAKATKKTRRRSPPAIPAINISYASIKSLNALIHAATEMRRAGKSMTKKEYAMYVRDIEAELISLMRGICIEMANSFDSFEQRILQSMGSKARPRKTG